MKRIFIDGLSGMAQGLFATLIIGTIIQQIGMFVGGNYGDLIYLIGKVAAALTGAGIGVGVARKLEAQQLVTVCAAVAGMIGAFAGKILAGQVLVDGNIVLAGPGEPLGAFVAAYVAIEIGILVTGRPKLQFPKERLLFCSPVNQGTKPVHKGRNRWSDKKTNNRTNTNADQWCQDNI